MAFKACGQTREEPVCAEQPRATWSLPPQDSYLMSQGDELKLQ
jgi:hypothetical protein